MIDSEEVIYLMNAAKKDLKPIPPGNVQLRNERRALGISQAKIALALERRQQAISLIDSGETAIDSQVGVAYQRLVNQMKKNRAILEAVRNETFSKRRKPMEDPSLGDFHITYESTDVGPVVVMRGPGGIFRFKINDERATQAWARLVGAVNALLATVPPPVFDVDK